MRLSRLGLVLARSMQVRGPLAVALLPLAWLFAAVATARRLAYRAGILRPAGVRVPVAVVGNITVGGTGKTPLVLWLAQALHDRGCRPGIVSRGYGVRAADPRPVRPEDTPLLVGDEPLLLARRSRCPVWIGRDRVAAARALLETHPECDVLISDDGLQHYRLRRDVEIAVIDDRGAGNGWHLPAGPLREPMARLASVDAVVINGDRIPAGLDPTPTVPVYSMRLVGERFRRLGDPTQTCGAEAFAGMRLHALAGIGNPQRFFDHLASLGLRFSPHAFPDHHAYTRADLAFPEADALLMTEKDGVKCAAFAPPITWVLPIDARIAPVGGSDSARCSGGLVELVLGKIDGRPAA